MNYPYESMRPLLAPLAELLFPARCLGCGKQLGSSRPPLLCKDCQTGIAIISPPFCPSCGAPSATRFCRYCQQHPFAFDRARSVVVYQEPVRSLIHQLKFNGSLAGLSSFAALAEEADNAAFFQEPDLLLPVPLHIRRLRWRGFNQSLFLAKACFPAWKEKIQPDLLQRHRATVPQTQLDGADRRSNLADAFSLQEPQAVKNKRILLVDDVFTTGSTLHECAKTLRQAGAAEIAAFTVARTVR
jgi:ComF family protein